MIKRKQIFLLLILLFSFMLSGCKQIFVTPVDPYEQVEVTKNDLQINQFYVKDGTKFINVWKPTMKTIGNNGAGTKQTIIFLTEDYKAVPTLYENEILAIASSDTEVKAPSLLRFKEIGYNIGFYGLTMDNDGYLCGSLNDNLYKKSSLYTTFENYAPSKEFRIISINGEPVSTDMLTSSAAGAFNCMEKEKEYSFEFYSGTYFYEYAAIADTFMLETFEYYELEEGENTKNGYISFHMPNGSKSGWYYIDGYGMFRYIAAPKGTNTSTIDMNEEYYENELEKIRVYSQRFSTTLDVRRENISFCFYYNSDHLSMDEIGGVIYAPNGSQYQLSNDTINNLLYCDLEEAMAGKWEFLIQPKNLEILKMEIKSNALTQEITEEELPIIIEQDQTNFYINITYEGEGEIYAIMVGPDNKMYEFTTYNKEHYISYLAPFLKAGKYNVKVYHYTDTKIGELTTQEDTKVQNDIITVVD